MTQVNWAELEHAYGPAGDVPALVEALGADATDARWNAARDLEARLAHQGSIYPASAPVVPLLLERMERRGAPDRDGVARLLGRIGWGQGEPGDEAAVAEALRQAAGRLAALLDDTSVNLRVALAPALAASARAGGALVEAVVRRLEREREPVVLFSLAPALHFGGSADPAYLAACEALLAAPADDPERLGRHRRLAGAAALALAKRGAAPEAAVEVLLEALADPAPYAALWGRSPWRRAGMAVELANLASFLGEARRPRVLPALASALERGGADAPGVAEALLFMAYGEGGAPAQASALEPAQREATARLARCDAAWNPRVEEVLGFAGLPAGRDALRAWLGERGEGILSREVELSGKRAPLHEHAQDMFSSSSQDAGALLDAVGGQLTPTEGLEALVEMAGGAYRLNETTTDREGLQHGSGVFDVWPARLATAALRDRPSVSAWATGALEARLGKPAQQGASVLLFKALAASTQGPFDARFDPLLPLNGVYDFHARVPAARLEQALLGQLAREAAALGEPGPGQWGIGFEQVARFRAPFLGLAPTGRLARALLGLGGLSGIWMDVEQAVEKHAQHPEVAEALAEFRRRVEGVQSYLGMRAALAGFVDEVYPPPSAAPRPKAQAKPKARKPAKKAAPKKTSKKKPAPKKKPAKMGRAKAKRR